jgi:hypothetical protein
MKKLPLATQLHGQLQVPAHSSHWLDEAVPTLVRHALDENLQTEPQTISYQIAFALSVEKGTQRPSLTLKIR